MLATRLLKSLRYSSYRYDQSLSLTSNIIKQNSIRDLMFLHQQNKLRFLPRMYVLTARRLGSLFENQETVHYGKIQRPLLDNFYEKFLQIDKRYLSPIQFLDSLYFLRSTQSDLKVNNSEQKIKNFQKDILHKLLIFLPYLEFNKHIEIIFQLSRIQIETKQVQKQCQAKVYTSMANKFKEQKIISYSSFHLSLLISFLIEEQNSSLYPRQLFIGVIQKLISICDDLPAGTLILTMNKILSHYKKFQADEQIQLMLKKIMSVMIRSLLQIMDQEPVFKKIQTEIFYEAKEELESVLKFLENPHRKFTQSWRMRLINSLNILPKISRQVKKEFY